MEVEEEESVGLGIGNKRKQRKEKKQQKLELSRQAMASTSDRFLSASIPKEQSEPPPELPKAPEEKIEAVVEEFEGLGLAGPKKKKPKKKKSEAASASGDAQAGPSAITPQATPGIPSQSTTQIPTASFPPPGAVPRSAPMDQSGQAPSSAWGRGRGRGQQQPPGPRFQPAFTPSQTIPQIAPRIQEPQSSLAVRSDSPKPQLGTPNVKPGQYSQEKIMCKYKIPLKNPGRTVGGRPLAILTNYLEMTFKPYNIVS